MAGLFMLNNRKRYISSIDTIRRNGYTQQGGITMMFRRCVSLFLSVLCVTAVLMLCLFPVRVGAQSFSTGIVTGDNVALRKNASKSSGLVARLDAGTIVTILQTNVNAEWHKVKANGKTGYINRLYVSLDPSVYTGGYCAEVINCKKSVNVRSSASKTASVIGEAKLGEKYEILSGGSNSSWQKIKYKGKTAFISKDYIRQVYKADNSQLTALSVKGGTLSPTFLPSEYAYIVRASSSKVTISTAANKGVKVSVDGTGKSSATVSVPDRSVKTVSITVNGKKRYTVLIERGTVLVGTWNIKRGNGNLEMQGRLVEGQQADILCLQEVFKKKSGSNVINNLLSLSTKQLKYNAFAKSIDSSGGDYGIGILSKYSLSGTTSKKIYSGGYEQRIYQKTVVKINGKKVSIYNTHLSFNNESIRKKQFTEILKAMDADKNPYKILFGDFNAAYSEFAVMKGYKTINTSSQKYYDPSGALIKKNGIDNILISDNISVAGSYMVKTSLSDHAPLFAFLVLK